MRGWTKQYVEMAREELLEKLLDGRDICGGLMNIYGLIDAEWQDNPRAVAEEIGGLLVQTIAWAKNDAEHGERRAKAEAFLKRIAEKYLVERPEIVRERAQEMVFEEAA